MHIRSRGIKKAWFYIWKEVNIECKYFIGIKLNDLIDITHL